MAFFNHGGMGGFFGGFGLVFMLIGVALMVVIFLAVVRAVRGANEPPAPTRHDQEQDQALRILEERFAHGEIDEVEYNERRSILEKNG